MDEITKVWGAIVVVFILIIASLVGSLIPTIHGDILGQELRKLTARVAAIEQRLEKEAEE